MITKAEAWAKLTAEENAEYESWEAKIDATLLAFDGRIDIDGMSSRVRVRLMAAYRTAGWTVEYGNSQRDCEWLFFS